MAKVQSLTVKTSRNYTAEQKKANAERIKQMQKEDEKLVKGKFQNHESPGCSVEFSYRKYKGEPIQFVSLQDGEICELPFGIAKHINTSKKGKRSFVLDANGNPTAKTHITGFTQRYSFTPVDFEG